MTIRNEILELEKKLNEADASQEIDTRYILEKLLSVDVIIVGPKGELYDKSFIQNAHGPNRVLFKNVNIEEMVIECFNDTAIVHSLNSYETNENYFKLRFFRVWHKSEGRWQVKGGSTTIVS